jgi:hypothetical protein
MLPGCAALLVMLSQPAQHSDQLLLMVSSELYCISHYSRYYTAQTVGVCTLPWKATTLFPAGFVA